MSTDHYIQDSIHYIRNYLNIGHQDDRHDQNQISGRSALEFRSQNGLRLALDCIELERQMVFWSGLNSPRVVSLRPSHDVQLDDDDDHHDTDHPIDCSNWQQLIQSNHIKHFRNGQYNV